MPVVGTQVSVMDDILIEVRGLKKYFPVTKGIITERVVAWVKAVDGIDFTVCKGETFGLVGESGCGKTTTIRCILLMEKPSVGSIFFKGKDILSLKGDDVRDYRRSLQVVMQDPTSALNPRMRVGEIISESITALGRIPKNSIKESVAEVLTTVGLGQEDASLYAHEFSGGQRQRIAIARALAPHPQCIILDEPVSALDVSIRAQILNLLKDIQSEFGLTYIIAAHDLSVVKYMSTRIGVMYLGKLVEIAESEELYSRPLHPYTQALFSAALPSHPDAQSKVIVLSGEVPSSMNLPFGCRFRPRCQYAKQLCSDVEPSLQEIAPGHWVACNLDKERWPGSMIPGTRDSRTI